jgi:allantoinase
MKAGEWTLRSRRVVTPSGTRAADVLIRKETIAELLEYDGPETEGVVLDVGDLAVLPGLVALHREGPGRLDAQRFEATTRDSGAGGVTTLIDLPSQLDLESADGSASIERMSAAEGKIRVDCGLVVPLGHGNAARIEKWMEAGFMGVEAILGDGSHDSASYSRETDLRAAMPILAELGRPLIVDSARISQPLGPSEEADRFASSLPEREFDAIRLLIRLCRETRCRVHLIHPSASEALPMIAEARAEGLPLTVLTCPRHLGFTPPEIADGVPTFPLDLRRRGLDARERLWEGLESGLIDGICPDLPRSTATSPSLSAVEFRFDHVETSPLRRALPAVWAEARRRGLTLDHLGRWLAGRTAAMLGLSIRKGSIAVGLDADFVVFDPDAITLAETESLESVEVPVPSDTRMLAGQVEATILRGNLIYEGGQFFEHPKGSVVLRLEATQPIPGTKN